MIEYKNYRHNYKRKSMNWDENYARALIIKRQIAVGSYPGINYRPTFSMYMSPALGVQSKQSCPRAATLIVIA